MDPVRTLLACVAISLSCISAQAQFQVVHDVPNTATTPELTPLILADGSTVTHHWVANEHIFRKYDTNGTLLWGRVLPAVGSSVSYSSRSIAMVDNGANGFRFVRSGGITFTDIDSLPNDTYVEIMLQVGNVDASGELTSTFELKKSYTAPFTDFAFFNALNAARTPDNGMVVTLCIGFDPGTREVLKIAADGTLEFVRSVGRSSSFQGVMNPTSLYEQGSQPKVAVSPTGEIYITGGGTNTSNLQLIALDPNGLLEWAKRYIYGNIPPSAGMHDIAVDAAGNVHAVGSLNNSVGAFHYFLRTNANGVLDRADLYRTSGYVGEGQLGIDAMGRRFHLVRPSDPLPATNFQAILIADTLGSPAQFIRRADQVVVPNNVFVVPQHMDVRGDRLAMSALLTHEDMDLAYTTRYETLSSLATDEVSSCLMDDTTLAHIPVPLDIMTTEDLTDAASIDVSAYYSSEPVALTLTDVGTEPLEALCTFVNEILLNEVGVGEVIPNAEAPLLLNTLVTQGTPIILTDPRATTVHVYTTYGALVQRLNVSGGKSIPTTGWAPGVYIVRALDAQDAPLQVGRVVVE